MHKWPGKTISTSVLFHDSMHIHINFSQLSEILKNGQDCSIVPETPTDGRTDERNDDNTYRRE